MRRKQLLLFSLILLCLPGYSYGQLWSGVLDPARAIDWTKAGAGTIPNRTTICSTLTSSATAAQINSAIAACPSGQVVSLGAGTYSISGQIFFNNKSNVTLRGAGPDQTFVKFTASGGCNGLGADVCVMNGDNNYSGDPHNVATWTAGYAKGTTSITLGAVTLGSINNLHVGSLLILDQDSDGSDTGDIYVCDSTTCSQQGGVGCGRTGAGGRRRVQMQQVTVTSITGSGPWTIGISPGLYAPNWRSGQAPGAWWSSGLPVTGVGIENISFDHTAVAATGAGIMFVNAATSWVKNVRSLNSALHKHVWNYQSSKITVRDSYFYGGTGTSENYGVDCGCSSSDILVENNIFQHIATATIGESGVGMVNGYNYAIDNYYIAGGGGWQQDDAYHHSAGDHFFLWEGNIGTGHAADAIHGSSFMLTTFRNYWNGYDTLGGGTKVMNTMAMQLMAYNRYLNEVGNVLGTATWHTNYEIAPTSGSDGGNSSVGDKSIYAIGWSRAQGTLFTGVPNDLLVKITLMRWGNYDTVHAAVQWNSSEVPSGLSLYANAVPGSQTLPASFYLNAKPSWWGTPPWPAIGPDVAGGLGPGGHAYAIPAQLCYNVTPKDINGILKFNANICYASTVITAPKNLRFP